MSDLQFLEWETDGPVATVWLNRPPVNAVDQQFYREIRAFFGDVERYLPDTRVIVLAGRGPHFCAGNDLAAFQTLDPDNAPEQLKQAREAFWAIYDSSYPVIAAVHGVAVGTGLAIAASCDLVVAAEDARFATPEVNVGVLGGAKHLSRLVPQGMVRLMHYTGDLYPAERLLPYGGIVEIVPRDQLLEKARDLARSIARHSPVTLRLAKRSLNGIEYRDLKSGYEFEQGKTRELSGYADSKEAVNAFLERREPVYTGR
ncbi:enoyl-CoA hydratase-related protein [Pseudonocardia kujensis]|uniref:enoyl-CoA hydratase-related protein n=1 Tax=Pseudonocardia kujensis TaxID=1128675 RepID=UPI001E3F179E|nr:enoyl-CoA hydratase-related protein [Pseudonocardia kujensis]MCE0768303.1 enoyl-CoA hydratase-related protein [Pseudonocardia kujensis]